MKIVVFDLGGTLMKYVGMPASWVEFYQQGFEAINDKFNCKISEEAIAKSVQMLKKFNPRINYREIEYPAEQIFNTVLKHWNIDVPVQDCIETFWSGLHLKTQIFSDTIDVLLKLKEKGYIIATLTDLPSAMPDEVFKRDIPELLKYFDYYVSSSVAGFRKPNCTGLRMISEKYNVPLEEIVFVGDEEKDRQTAKYANCKFIHIEREKECDDGVKDLLGVLELLMKNTIDFTTITACGAFD